MIVEVLVGIALLGTVAAAAQHLHGSAVEARLRSVDRTVALWELRSLAEELHARRTPVTDRSSEVWDVRIGPSSLVLSMGTSMSPPLPLDPESACAEDPAPGAEFVVHVRADRQDGMQVATLSSRPAIGDRGATDVDGQLGSGAELSVRIVGAQGPIAGADVIVGPWPNDAADPQHVALTDASGCSIARELVVGQHRVQVEFDGAIDRLHRPLDALDVQLAMLGRARLVVHADRAAALRTTIVAADEAQLPDPSAGAELRWVVAGDGVVEAASSGEERLLHPGWQEVVVGVCGSPFEHATWVRSLLEAGQSHDVEVRLPSAQLPAVDVPPGGALLVAQRDADCPGTGGVRPELRWNLSNSFPTAQWVEPLIAIPHGRWQVRIQSASGALLAGPFALFVTASASEAPS
jgi:hypothetical protein